MSGSGADESVMLAGIRMLTDCWLKKTNRSVSLAGIYWHASFGERILNTV